MDLACLDTQILVWGLKEQATEVQQDMIPKAKAFLRHLDNKGTRVLVPALVVAELLMPVPPEQHAIVTNLFERSFMIGDFNLRASSFFARIWRSKIGDGTVASLQAVGVFRAELRTDCLIVATAVAHGASCIYSNDERVRRFADGHIRAMEMPSIPEQLDLFPDRPTAPESGPPGAT
jgi:predicted nucleic acid-binding protein